MPVASHTRVVARGGLGDPSGANPPEQWSCGLNLNTGASEDLMDPAELLAIAVASRAAWATFFSTAASKVVNTATLKEVRGYRIGADGHMIAGPAVAGGTSVAGATGGVIHPLQCTLVVTLVAGTYGKGRFGRIFLPPQGMEVQSDGLIGVADLNPVITQIATLLDAHNALPAPTVTNDALVVISQQTSPGDADFPTGMRAVTDFKVGRVFDTQRRRRRSLVEGYITHALAS